MNKTNDDLNDDKKVNKVFIRSPYNYDTKQASLDTGLECRDASRTQQSHYRDTDINYIVRQFGVTGMLPQSVNMPTYQEFDAVFDYQTALNTIIEADAQFLTLPSHVREAFGHSPHNLIQYLNNNPDPQKLVDLGIAEVFKDNRAKNEGISVGNPE